MEDLSTLARAGDVRALRSALADLDVPAVVDELGRLDPIARAVTFRALPKDLSLAVFEDLDPAIQGELLEGLREDAVRDLIADLDPDDRASLLDELPAGVTARLLSGLDARERAMTTVLLGYPSRSAGRRMTPQVVSVPVSATVGQALEHVRRHEPDAETIYTLPVLGAGRRVEGVVSLRRLFVTDPGTAVREVMSDPVVVGAGEDQEHAARVVRDHGLVAVPVVDAEDRLLGVFTVDDAMRVLEHEESEDAARAAATEPLRRPYLSTTVLGLVRSRALWLLVLIAAATLTVNVLDHFEETLAQVVALALFVPLLIGTAGNTGAQAATTVVRAMAVGDVRFGDLPRVVGRECLTGLLLGLLLGAVGFVPATVVAGPQIALVLALALVAVCTLATTTGALTPMIARRVGVDPAVVSAPFITTFVDATGLIVYFLIAQAVLGL
ncbi:magnesium transporter [Cellulomonas bogoriensis]|uniref:Magnesium transporter MgtE n=1 Tax=Cellulomonas bogoriensis 69B4 = DSM 16987 TaxID=1386082 RepID=A0A0A0C118_9CELL|nr:magnesium transporter [Cellulomonas bogoriensis]KGM13911.1 magnesium transporter [Cellulomonas bogoriensis 69B4 = DSM 16987]